ncbi:MAG: hypothetical protein SWE60_22165 [Thermodesulfobacteriota bacterium]|nr:hypothetical protein [Thermodesulfobacteriota bacterium]
MKGLLFVLVGVFLSCSVTVVAADTDGFLGSDSNPSTAPAFDRIFEQAKEGGGSPPLLFQKKMYGEEASVLRSHSSVQELVDRFFSEDFDPLPLEENGDDSLPFFSEEGAEESDGLGSFMGDDWLWSPGAYGGDTWSGPQVWDDTGQ